MTGIKLWVIVATREGDSLFYDADSGYFEGQKWKATRFENYSHAKRVMTRLYIMNQQQDREDRYDSIEVRTWESLK